MNNELVPAELTQLEGGLYTAACTELDCDWRFTTSEADILSAVRVHQRQKHEAADSLTPTVESRGEGSGKTGLTLASFSDQKPS